MAHRKLVSRCWGCNEPLPRGPFESVHWIYHDEECRALHKAELDAFYERCPELPDWGRSPVRRPAKGDVLRVVRLEASKGLGRMGVRFVKGPARAEVVRRHDEDTLPLSYYVGKETDEAAAADFLRESYPLAEVQSLS